MSAVVTAVHDRTGGNPFFVTELVRLLSSEHALDDAERMARAGVPVGARDVVRRRLTRLPEQAVVALGVAAVIGPQIDIRLLASMTGIGMDELVDLLELAGVSGMISESADEPGQYRFSHDLVREAIYDALPGMRRAALHRDAASALLELHGDVPRVAHEVARHAVAAVPAAGPDQALSRLRVSVRVAQAQLSVDLAERQLRLGLRLLAEAPPTPERQLREAEFESYLGQFVFYTHGRAEDAAAHLQRARRLCPTEASESRLDLLMGQAAMLPLWGDLGGALDAADELVAAARVMGNQQAESDGLYYRAVGAWTGDLAGALEAVDRSIALGEAIEQGGPTPGPHVPLACKYGLRGVIRVLADEAPAALEDAEAAVYVAAHERSGSWAVRWAGAFALLATALAGRPDDVDRLWEVVARSPATLAYPDAAMLVCREWSSAIRAPTADPVGVAEARRALADAGDAFLLVPAALLEVEVLLMAGAHERAFRVIEEARLHSEKAGQLAWLPRIGRLAARARSSQRAPADA